jgi:hypothetical protein
MWHRIFVNHRVLYSVLNVVSVIGSIRYRKFIHSHPSEIVIYNSLALQTRTSNAY